MVNTNTDEAKQDLFETGTYDYGMQANTATPELCNEVILLNGIDYGCFGIDNGQLIISQIEADGYYIKLIRFWQFYCFKNNFLLYFVNLLLF